MKNSLSILSLGLLLTSPRPSIAAEDYAIRMFLPWHTGDKALIQARGTRTTETTVTEGSKTIRKELKTFTAEIESRLTILAVSTNGNAVKVEHVIDKLVRIDGEQRISLLPKGSVVTMARKTGKPVIELNGQPLPPEVAEAMQLAAPGVGERSTDDDVFGTKERKKVGERWSGNLELMKIELTREAPAVVKSITCTTTLKDARKDSRGTVLMLASDVSATLDLPPSNGMKYEVSDVVFKAGGELPVQPDKPASESSEFTTTFVKRGKASAKSPEIVIKTLGTTQHFVTKRPIK